MFQAFLIKYGEIGVKGKNRYVFEDALVKRIKEVLRPVEGHFQVTKDQGRIYVEAEGAFDYEEAVEALRRVFGIVSICPVVIVEDHGLEALCAPWMLPGTWRSQSPACAMRWRPCGTGAS